jgi:hypothetical protein
MLSLTASCMYELEHLNQTPSPYSGERQHRCETFHRYAPKQVHGHRRAARSQTFGKHSFHPSIHNTSSSSLRQIRIHHQNNHQTRHNQRRRYGRDQEHTPPTRRKLPLDNPVLSPPLAWPFLPNPHTSIDLEKTKRKKKNTNLTLKVPPSPHP